MTPVWITFQQISIFYTLRTQLPSLKTKVPTTKGQLDGRMNFWHDRNSSHSAQALAQSKQSHEQIP